MTIQIHAHLSENVLGSPFFEVGQDYNRIDLIECVVSLCCRTDEGSRRKCGQYWPLDEGGQEVYCHMAVVNQRVDNHTHYNHTTLELHNTEVQTWTNAIRSIKYYFNVQGPHL